MDASCRQFVDLHHLMWQTRSHKPSQNHHIILMGAMFTIPRWKVYEVSRTLPAQTTRGASILVGHAPSSNHDSVINHGESQMQKKTSHNHYEPSEP